MIIRNRINSITKLQSIGILLVVIGHSIPHRDISQYPPAISWMQYFIYSFHMPLFMFLSGFLFILTNRTRKIVYHRFVLKKAKRLLVPYIILSSLAYIIKINMSEFALRPITPGFIGYLHSLIYPQDNPIIFYWFLPTLFLIFLVAPALKKITNINSIAITMVVLVLLYLLNIYDAANIKILNIWGLFHYLFYFFLGITVCYYFNERLQMMGLWYVVSALLVLLILANSFSMTMAINQFRILTALLGIGFSVSLAQYIDRSRPTIFRSFDQYYYQIFLLSWFPQISVRLLYQLNYVNYYVIIILMLVGGLYGPVIVAKIVERHLSKMKFIIGLN